MKKETSLRMKSSEKKVKETLTTKMHSSRAAWKKGRISMTRRKSRTRRSRRRRTFRRPSTRSATTRTNTRARGSEDASKGRRGKKCSPSRTRRKYSSRNPKGADTTCLDIINLSQLSIYIESFNFTKDFLVIADEGPKNGLQTIFVQSKPFDFLRNTPISSVFVLINVKDSLSLHIWPVLDCCIFYG